MSQYLVLTKQNVPSGQTTTHQTRNEGRLSIRGKLSPGSLGAYCKNRRVWWEKVGVQPEICPQDVCECGCICQLPSSPGRTNRAGSKHSADSEPVLRRSTVHFHAGKRVWSGAKWTANALFVFKLTFKNRINTRTKFLPRGQKKPVFSRRSKFRMPARLRKRDPPALVQSRMCGVYKPLTSSIYLSIRQYIHTYTHANTHIIQILQ